MHWLSEFCTWLDQTAPSQIIQTTGWVVPTVQTIHILAVAVVMGSALMIDLRLFGLVGNDQPTRRVWARFSPLVWWPLLVLFATGAIMITGEPARSLMSPVFQFKMALLVAAVTVTGIQQSLLRADTTWADPAARRSYGAWLLAMLSVLLWAGIIFAGRWIAYW